MKKLITSVTFLFYRGRIASFLLKKGDRRGVRSAGGRGAGAGQGLQRKKSGGHGGCQFADPMGTTGGIAAVKIRRLTIGIITRALSEQEKKEGLVYRPVTRQAVVVGMHKSFSIGDLNESQVCDIFAGKIKSWKDIGASEARIVVVGRKLDDNDMKVFRDKMVCFKNLQLAPEAVLLDRGSDVLDALNNRPGTVGVTGAGAAFFERANIKTAVIGGVSPSLEGVKSGKYKYYSEFGFVTIGEPSGTAKRFADFVTSAEGEKILEKYHAAGAR